MQKKERFLLFIERLKTSSPANSFETGRCLVDDCLNFVEDLYSGMPYNPEQWLTDGRMYPPADDSERKSTSEKVRRFRTRNHYLEIGDNGAIRILLARSEEVIIDKAGANGATVSQLILE
jgi:hypothetical protein